MMIIVFFFPTSARKHTPRSPRGAIYEFTPQMRIMALIRDIWLEHCRGSPHACPRRFLTLCAAVLVSHRWLQPQPLHIYIYIYITRNFRPLFSDSPIVNRFSAATFPITRTRTPCSSRLYPSISTTDIFFPYISNIPSSQGFRSRIIIQSWGKKSCWSIKIGLD